MVLALQLGTVVDSDGWAHAAMEAAVFTSVDESIISVPDGKFPSDELSVVNMSERQIVTGDNRTSVELQFLQIHERHMGPQRMNAASGGRNCDIS